MWTQLGELSVRMIETALAGEMVAKNHRCQTREALNDCRTCRRIHEGMCWGAAAHEKNGSTTS